MWLVLTCPASKPIRSNCTPVHRRRVSAPYLHALLDGDPLVPSGLRYRLDRPPVLPLPIPRRNCPALQHTDRLAPPRPTLTRATSQYSPPYPSGPCVCFTYLRPRQAPIHAARRLLDRHPPRAVNPCAAGQSDHDSPAQQRASFGPCSSFACPADTHDNDSQPGTVDQR